MLQTALTENVNQRQLIIYPAETSRPSRSTEQPRRPRFLAPIKGIYSHSGVAYAEIHSAHYPLYEYTTDEHPLYPAGYYPGDWEITSENPPRWRYTGTLIVFHDEEDDRDVALRKLSKGKPPESSHHRPVSGIEEREEDIYGDSLGPP